MLSIPSEEQVGLLDKTVAGALRDIILTTRIVHAAMEFKFEVNRFKPVESLIELEVCTPHEFCEQTFDNALATKRSRQPAHEV